MAKKEPGKGAPPGDGQDSAAIREAVERRVRQEAEGRPQESDRPEITHDFVEQCLWANELGDGLLFTALHRDRFVYNTQAAEWLFWNGHHWEPDIMSRAKAAVEDVVDRYQATADHFRKLAQEAKESNDSETARRLDSKVEKLRTRVSRLRTEAGRNRCLDFAAVNRDPLAIKGDELDCMPWLLPCINGVVDLLTGWTQPGDPADYLMRAAPTAWAEEEAQAPTWERFLLEIMSDDPAMVAYLQRMFGYAITGLTTEHVFVVLHGQGRNGKSLLVEVLSQVLGALAGPIPSEMLLDQGNARSSAGPSPDIMALRGLRLAFASETDEGRKFSPSRCKWFSGGDSLTGRYPHDKRLVTFSPTHLLFLLTNHKPHAPAEDFAFWERLHLVPFELSFVDREPRAPNERRADKELKDKLLREAPGILAWLVRGCLEWQRDGLAPPEKVREATAEYRRDEDLLGDFLEECCDVATERPDDVRTSATDLYDAFMWWFRANVSRKKSFSQKSFGKMLGKRFRREKVGGSYKYFGLAVREDVFARMRSQEEDDQGRL